MTNPVTITRIDLREVAATWTLFAAIDHRYLAYASRRIRLRKKRKGGQR